MVHERVFSRVRREARAWIKAPSDDALAQIASTARGATDQVPEARRADWEKLLAGFVIEEGDARRRSRVEAMLRACTLFERQQRDRERQATRLGWEEPVRRTEGIGPSASETLGANGLTVVGDLLWTLPIGWDDLRAPLSVRQATEIARADEASLGPPPRLCVQGVVRSAVLVPMRRKRAVRVILADAEDALPGPADPSSAGAPADQAPTFRRSPAGASLDAWWFYAAHGVLAAARAHPQCVLVGRIRVREGKRPSMAHPDLVRDDEIARGVRPRYPRLGIAPGTLRRAIRDAVTRTSPLPDPVPPEVVLRERMLDVEPLLRAVHGATFDGAATTPQPVGLPGPPRQALAERLAWVEAFTRVWQRLLAHQAWGGAHAPVLARNERVTAGFIDALGFAPTGAQRRAIETIARDLASRVPMRRLLLGDVGTGKTAVALAAAAQCVAAGCQCALLVPTAVLAEQYVEAAAPLVRSLGVRLERITAGMRAPERRGALAAIASGQAQVAVGTHALLEQGVAFARLGLVVVDEQQRLGVAQRLTLVRKGEGSRPHLLSLSATPIPRTLALALRGELATTVLDERPPHRGPVTTVLFARARLDAVVGEVRATAARGERVFFVCSRIDDDEDEEEEIGAHARGDYLTRELAPVRVVVVHGAMPVQERIRAIGAFRRGEALVLVGTTVVEVGLDVPEATLMVVDGAERFGLAQLHQLRGRVGRGDRPGRCLLVHDEPLLDLARRRLETLAGTNDGAAIARADLALRGAGDLGGTRQSGIVEDFAWLDPTDPPGWIERIESDASAILARDPMLTAPEHRALAFAVRRFAVAIAVREEAG